MDHMVVDQRRNTGDIQLTLIVLTPRLAILQQQQHFNFVVRQHTRTRRAILF